MTECNKCGMNYDSKEYEMCPYCGEENVIETGTAIQAVKAEEKGQSAKKPIKQQERPLSKRKSVGEKAGGSLKYIMIGVAAVAVIAAAVIGLSFFSGSGVTVPDQYATIQEAIDAAQDGEEIVVQVGVYRENIDFRGKNIIVRSTDPDDPAVVSATIIDGGGWGPVVSFRSGEGEGAVLSGFTVKRGAGILVSGGSSPLIEKCLIEDNSAEFGAGFYIVDSNPVIRGNRIVGNSAYFGGGVFIEESSPVLEGNTIAGNVAEMGGGIVIISNSSPVITGNMIVENQALRLGGGMVIAINSNPAIRENTIAGNQAERNGGGILIEESEPTIEGNTIKFNRSANGGAIFIVNSLGADLTIADNEITDNLAHISGGGIYLDGSSATIRNNTLRKNISTQRGGAIFLFNSVAKVLKNIFEGNEASLEFGGGAISVAPDSTLEFSDPDDNTYINNIPNDIVSEQ